MATDTVKFKIPAVEGNDMDAVVEEVILDAEKRGRLGELFDMSAMLYTRLARMGGGG